MATINFDALDNDADWRQALSTLVADAARACQPGSSPIDREAARDDLRSFRNYPCPFEDMRRTALEAINDLTLADIDQALGALQDLQRQLKQDKSGFVLARTAAAQPLSQLRRARTTMAALHAYSAEQPGLTEQLDALKISLDQLISNYSSST